MISIAISRPDENHECEKEGGVDVLSRDFVEVNKQINISMNNIDVTLLANGEEINKQISDVN